MMKDAAELLSQAVEAAESPRETGIVKYFNNAKGYSFIKRRNGKPDVFVHHTEILGKENYKTLLVDQPVEFSVDDSAPKGPTALRVKVLG